MNDPLVSIVTPSFNQGRFLEATILSVLNQTYSNIEYLVLDGGSTDESAAVIKKHAARLAYWHSRRDQGFADAVAQGFERSTGSILAYLNSDDLLAPDAVERAVKVLNSEPHAVMVYGNRVCIDQEGQFLYAKVNLPILSRSPYIAMIISQETCFWPREAYLRAGGMDRNLRFAIDYDLFSRFARMGKIVHCPELWGFFRKHHASKTMTQFQNIGKEEGRIVQLRHWGRSANAISWLAVSCLMRMYALAAMPFVTLPEWPTSLPARRPANLVARWWCSLHETSFLKRLLRPGANG